MIEKIIEYSARNRVIVLMIFGLIIAWGVWSVYKTPVDAIPDLSDNQVIVFTDYPGPFAAGGGGPGHLSAGGQPAGPAPGTRRAGLLAPSASP